MQTFLVSLLALMLLAFTAGCNRDAPSADENNPPIVLAASSLQESLEAAADAWAVRGHSRPVLSFAATSALARQIDSGAPADLFLAADQDWMDHAQARGRIKPATRADLIGNALVLIAPSGSALEWRAGDDLAAALDDGKLAMADPDAVPAGKYGKAALENLGQWDAVSPGVVRGENVRAALAFVERREAAAGIVYATDAMASGKVRVVAIFPAASHPPITYPIAILTSSTSEDAPAFARYLRSPEGRAVFQRFGFTAP